MLEWGDNVKKREKLEQIISQRDNSLERGQQAQGFKSPKKKVSDGLISV